MLLVDDETEEWALKKLREDCPGNWRLIHNESIGSHGKAMNIIANLAWREGNNWMMYIHNDCKVTNPNAMEDLYRIIENLGLNARPVLVQGEVVCMVEGKPFPHSSSWFCFAINKLWWDAIGPWDERYRLFWDWDYEYRMHMAGLRGQQNHVRPGWNVGIHNLSSTLQKYPEARAQPQDKERFKEKWGFPVW